jgi:hypothetical protein
MDDLAVPQEVSQAGSLLFLHSINLFHSYVITNEAVYRENGESERNFRGKDDKRKAQSK